MTRELMAAGALLVLLGMIAGWCAGWAARGEQNRAWHHGTLNRVHGELAQALVELDATRAELDATRARWQATPPAPVVTLQVVTPLPWIPAPPLIGGPVRVLPSVPAQPAEEAEW